MPIESWRKVFREGFAPVLPTLGLEKLADALRSDDPRLTQGSTTTPPPLLAVMDWPIEGTDAIGFCVWQASGLQTVGEVEGAWAAKCTQCDELLGEPAACRYLLNYLDDTPRTEMRRELLAEVEAELSRRRCDSEADSPLLVELLATAALLPLHD